MPKDANKYQIFTEFDAKTEKAVVTFGKNDRVVKFNDLPSREQDILRAMVIEISRIVLPEEVPDASAIEPLNLETEE